MAFRSSAALLALSGGALAQTESAGFGFNFNSTQSTVTACITGDAPVGAIAKTITATEVLGGASGAAKSYINNGSECDANTLFSSENPQPTDQDSNPSSAGQPFRTPTGPTSEGAAVTSSAEQRFFGPTEFVRVVIATASDIDIPTSSVPSVNFSDPSAAAALSSIFAGTILPSGSFAFKPETTDAPFQNVTETLPTPFSVGTVFPSGSVIVVPEATNAPFQNVTEDLPTPFSVGTVLPSGSLFIPQPEATNAPFQNVTEDVPANQTSPVVNIATGFTPSGSVVPQPETTNAPFQNVTENLPTNQTSPVVNIATGFIPSGSVVSIPDVTGALYQNTTENTPANQANPVVVIATGFIPSGSVISIPDPTGAPYQNITNPITSGRLGTGAGLGSCAFVCPDFVDKCGQYYGPECYTSCPGVAGPTFTVPFCSLDTSAPAASTGFLPSGSAVPSPNTSGAPFQNTTEHTDAPQGSAPSGSIVPVPEVTGAPFQNNTSAAPSVETVVSTKIVNLGNSTVVISKDPITVTVDKTIASIETKTVTENNGTRTIEIPHFITHTNAPITETITFQNGTTTVLTTSLIQISNEIPITKVLTKTKTNTKTRTLRVPGTNHTTTLIETSCVPYATTVTVSSQYHGTNSTSSVENTPHTTVAPHESGVKTETVTKYWTVDHSTQRGKNGTSDVKTVTKVYTIPAWMLPTPIRTTKGGKNGTSVVKTKTKASTMLMPPIWAINVRTKSKSWTRPTPISKTKSKTITPPVKTVTRTEIKSVYTTLPCTKSVCPSNSTAAVSVHKSTHVDTITASCETYPPVLVTKTSTKNVTLDKPYEVTSSEECDTYTVPASSEWVYPSTVLYKSTVRPTSSASSVKTAPSYAANTTSIEYPTAGSSKVLATSTIYATLVKTILYNNSTSLSTCSIVASTTMVPVETAPVYPNTTPQPSAPVSSPGVPITQPHAPGNSSGVYVPEYSCTESSCLEQPTVPASVPMVPISSPEVPVSSPEIPVTSPYAPVSTPVVPVSSSEVPASSPEVPISSPYAPVSSPVVSGEVPSSPVAQTVCDQSPCPAQPSAPGSPPVVPVSPPVVSAPVTPGSPPMAPMSSPVVPEEVPSSPATPQQPYNPEVPVSSPVVPGEIPSSPATPEQPSSPAESPYVSQPSVPGSSPAVPAVSDSISTTLVGTKSIYSSPFTVTATRPGEVASSPAVPEQPYNPAQPEQPSSPTTPEQPSAPVYSPEQPSAPIYSSQSQSPEQPSAPAAGPSTFATAPASPEQPGTAPVVPGSAQPSENPTATGSIPPYETNGVPNESASPPPAGAAASVTINAFVCAMAAVLAFVMMAL